MAKFKVIDEAYVKYQMTTWQGEIEINGETILYRYSEDDNGAELYVFNEDQGWFQPDLEENENHAMLYTAIMEWGNPEEFGASGEEFEEDLDTSDYI